MLFGEKQLSSFLMTEDTHQPDMTDEEDEEESNIEKEIKRWAVSRKTPTKIRILTVTADW